MNLKSASFVIVLTLLLGCSPRNEKPLYIDGDDLIPPEPSVKSFFTIHGEDVDNDGVRDDIELYVNKNFEDPNVRKAFKSDAKTYSSFMKATNRIDINKYFVESIDTSICLNAFHRTVKGFDSDDIVKWSESLYSTPWRRMHFNEQGRMVKSDIYSWGGTSIMSKLKRCKFTFTNLDKSLQFYLKDNYKYGMTLEEIKEFENIMGIKSQPLITPKKGRKNKGAAINETITNKDL